MIVKVEVMYDEVDSSGRTRDKVIRAINQAMGGADWESNGEGWIARR